MGRDRVYDPNEGEFVDFETLADWEERDRAKDARIEALEAQVRAADALADWVEGIIEDGCPKCGGDCSAANPPVAYCPQREAMNDLAAYRATKEGGA